MSAFTGYVDSTLDATTFTAWRATVVSSLDSVSSALLATAVMLQSGGASINGDVDLSIVNYDDNALTLNVEAVNAHFDSFGMEYMFDTSHNTLSVSSSSVPPSGGAIEWVTRGW